MIDLSIVIPAYNEYESLPELVEWIDRVISKAKLSTEVIIVDDGSSDSTWSVIKDVHAQHSMVHGIKFRRNYGKSAALHVAFQASKGDVVITMDADMQDSPDEIPDLVRMIREDGYDMVSGWKKKRHDPISKTIPSKFFNKVTQWVSGIKLHDFNCGLKSYRGEVARSLEIYGEMHRYIPVMAKAAGFGRIGEKVVEHRARKYGVSKFGLERFVNGLLDLMSISFVGKFGKRPMHFFGTWGLIVFFIGTGILVYLTIMKTLFDTPGIAERPLFFFGILLFIIGTQLFLAGFLGELISRSSADRNAYQIAEQTEV